MDEQTALVLSLQLLALFSIAGALLLYLLCKIRATNTGGMLPGAGKAVLVTCCDNAAGLQIALHLANQGFRVFAGIRDAAQEESVTNRVIRGWQKYRESVAGGGGCALGSLLSLPLDVTREDLLREAVDIIRAHLPAGEDGIWAVINTSGVSYRGRLEQQDIAHWDTILKTNVVGLLRTARAFHCLLRNTKGRLLHFGQQHCPGAGLVAYTASKYAVEGASEALRQELSTSGIQVVNLRTVGLEPEMLYTPPKISIKEESTQETSVDIDYQPTVLTPTSLAIFDVALTIACPKDTYLLTPKSKWSLPTFNFAKA